MKVRWLRLICLAAIVAPIGVAVHHFTGSQALNFIVCFSLGLVSNMKWPIFD